jgi:hypothetical protein
MDSISRLEFIQQMAPMLKQAGFKKTRSTWHKEYLETIAVFNVQASQWGPEYYLNTAIYVKVLGPETAPPEHHCHLRSRLEMNKKSVDSIFQETISWFEKNSSLAGLRLTIIAEPNIPVLLALKKHLNIA